MIIVCVTCYTAYLAYERFQIFLSNFRKKELKNAIVNIECQYLMFNKISVMRLTTENKLKNYLMVFRKSLNKSTQIDI
jgi:hypothetical protein